MYVSYSRMAEDRSERDAMACARLLLDAGASADAFIVDEAIGLIVGPLQGLLADGHVPSGRDVQHHRHSSPVAAEGDEVDPARPIDCGMGLEQPEVQDEDARGAGDVGHWPRAGRSGMGGKFSRATLEPCRPIRVDAHGVRVHREPTPESHPRR